MNTMEERLCKVIKSGLDLEENTKLDLNSNLEELGLNSMTLIQIVVLAEEEFGIEFGDDDLNAALFTTGQKFLNFIQKKLEEQ